MNKPLVKQLLLSTNYWVLPKNLVQIFGLETAFLLSNFAEAETMMQDKEGWFYQTSEKVEEMTTLSRHKQDQCIKQLEEMKVLEKDVRGMPAKRYFRINYDRLTNLIVKNSQTGLLNIDKQVCKKSTTNKEHIYKEHNYKESTTKEVEDEVILNSKDIEFIIEEWNKLELQQLRTLNHNTKRYKSLKSRIDEYSFDEVIEAIRKIEESSFLKGHNDRGWTITFDWLVRPNNFIKVLEGNYTDKEANRNGKHREDGGNTTKEADRLKELAIKEGLINEDGTIEDIGEVDF